MGQYVAADLQPGQYNLRAEAPGFKSVEQKDLVLNVGDRSRVDFKLEVGNTQESVTVEANTIAVQSETGEVSNVITGQQVSQLATNGRSLYSLAGIAPGTSSNQADFQNPVPVGGDGTVGFNGLRVSHNLYMVDGGEDDDRGGSGNISIMPRRRDRGIPAAYIELQRGVRTFIRRHDDHQQESRQDFLFLQPGMAEVGAGWTLQPNGPRHQLYGGQFNTPIYVPKASQISPELLASYAALGLVPGQEFPGNKIPASLMSPQAQALLNAGIFPAANSGTQFIGGNKQPES